MSRNASLANNTGIRLAIIDYLWRFWWLTVPLWCCLLLCRFVSGRNMGGGHSTDATFFRPAREVRMSWWANQRGCVRLAVRLGVFVALWLWVVVPVVVYVALVLGAVFLVRALLRRYRQRKHELAMVWPVWPVIAGIIGVPDSQPASRWVEIPAPAAETNTDLLVQRYDGTPVSIVQPNEQPVRGRFADWWQKLCRRRRADNIATPLVPDPDEPIVVGLRAADADDDRRVRSLVQLFDQRYGRAHYGRVDYGQRLVIIEPRPVEQPYWPYVAHILDVAADDREDKWMRVEYPPADSRATGPRVTVTVPHGTLLDKAKSDLKLLLADEYGGDWEAHSAKYNRRVLALSPKPPESTPPSSVGLGEHPDYHQTTDVR